VTDDHVEPLNPEIIDQLKAQACQKRKHATHFAWHDRSAQGKGIAEAGLVDDLLTAMQDTGHVEYRSLGASGEEWPDVWLKGTSGERVPCEVAELVDAAAMSAGSSRPEIIAELVERVQAILDRKGRRSLGGASGPRSVLVIHTDEFHLNADNVGDVPAGTVFKKPGTIQRAFFLLSYDPNRRGYRYFELRLAA
jgi:hypothetical protein